MSEGVPKFVMSHSMGGLISLEYFSNSNYPKNPGMKISDIKGLIATSPFLAPADKIPWIKLQLCKILGRCVPWLTLPSDLTADQLTSCSQKQKEQNEDIVIFRHATLGFGYHAMLAQARAIENLASSPFPLPFFMMFSLQDMVCDPEVNEHTASKIYSFVKF